MKFLLIYTCELSYWPGIDMPHVLLNQFNAEPHSPMSNNMPLCYYDLSVINICEFLLIFEFALLH